MKKYFFALMISLFIIVFQLELPASADSDSYDTYNEIMMSSGKLLANFTQEEYAEYYKYVQKTTFWGINVHVVNQNIPATYISATLYSVENRGQSDISYELDVVVELAHKTSWNVSGNISGSGKGNIKTFKSDLAAKAGVEYSSTTTSSRKETQKMKITVEKQSRAIVYLMGNARVTNGVCSYYMFFVNLGNDGFEYFTILNQYPRMEKRSI